MTPDKWYEISLDGIALTVKEDERGHIWYRDELSTFCGVYGPTAERVKECVMDEHGE